MEDPHEKLIELFAKYTVDPSDTICLSHIPQDTLELFYVEYRSILDLIQFYNNCKNEAVRQATTAKFRLVYKEPEPDKRIALTICPESHNTYHILDKIVVLVKSCTAIKGGKYVYEQRSEGDEPEYGWHIHLVVDSDYPPSKVRQFVQQKLKSKGINATYWATRADDKWEKNYMEGDKHDKTKVGKVKKDAILRDKYGLQKIYLI